MAYLLSAAYITKSISGVILGVIQGISEWLPISSKTQIIIASNYLLNLNFQQAYTFGLFMEVGTILAAAIYFRNELASLSRALLGAGTLPQKRLLAYVVVTTVITGVIGAPLYLIADSITGASVGIPMLVIGMVLIFDALLIRHSRKSQKSAQNGRRFEDLKLRDYLLVGAAQGIAALPGVSRSGITTSTMLLLGVKPGEAFRLSFLIGIFASTAAFLLTLVATGANVSAALEGIGIYGLTVAMITSTLVSLLLIDFLIKIASKSKIVYLTAALGVIAIASGSLYLAFSL